MKRYQGQEIRLLVDALITAQAAYDRRPASLVAQETWKLAVKALGDKLREVAE